MPIFPPFDIIEKGWSDQTDRVRVFAVTIAWVMEENKLRYTQVYVTLMILAIRVKRKQITTRRQAWHSITTDPTKISINHF